MLARIGCVHSSSGSEIPSHTVSRSPSFTASAALAIFTETITNSSPAKRARKSEPRKARRILAAVARSAASPCAWPCASLIAFRWSRSTNNTVNRLPNALADLISVVSVASNIARLGRPVKLSVKAIDSRCSLCALSSYCLRLSSRFCSASCAINDSMLVVNRSTSRPPPRGAGAVRLRDAVTASAQAVKSATGRSIA